MIKLKLLRKEAESCTKCPELVENRTKVVFGEGNENAKIFFCGEAGGKNEDLEGRPFVGQAGKLLDNMIKSCNWKREDVYIANCTCCRPPNNRIPTEIECNNCRPFLDGQIEAVNPKYLILLGSTASNNLLKIPVSKARGKIHTYKNIKTIVTYHPAYLLRNPSKKKDVWEDLQVVIREIENEDN